MKTTHAIHFQSAEKMEMIPDRSINLVITSPPYPMIEMWDEIFGAQNPKIAQALGKSDGQLAYRLMHRELEKVWTECFRVLKIGGIMCINIGDATRTIGKNFQLFPSHGTVINQCQSIGFQSLPEIIWRKQTNAPNKFMGSGMLPPGAYVTLEHEYILIFRKGSKREFKSKEEKQNRNESAYFWEERNLWFSDLWDFKGTSQILHTGESRKRSAAYPFELAYRLIHMFSAYGDTVLDPFLGTGTTTFTSMVGGRNSMGFEIDTGLDSIITQNLEQLLPFSKPFLQSRWDRHLEFVKFRRSNEKPVKHQNEVFDVGVITGQERKLKLFLPTSINKLGKGEYEVEYAPFLPHMILNGKKRYKKIIQDDSSSQFC
jgi:modification methylase